MISTKEDFEMQNNLSKNGQKPEQFGRRSNGQFNYGHTYSRYSDEERQKQFEAYLIHRSYGRRKRSFSRCFYVELEKWANSDPIKKEELQLAEARGLAYWEAILDRVALGLDDVPYQNPINGKATTIKPTKINTSVLIFLLKAKYPDIYGDKATSGANNDSGNYGDTIPRSTGFYIIANGVIEEFPMLGADPNSYNPSFNS